MFYINVPGLRVDHEEVDWENLYSKDEIVSYDEEGLRKAIENLPRATTNKKGTEQGDPLNLVVVGDHDDVHHAFVRAGWDETETIYATSLLKQQSLFSLAVGIGILLSVASMCLVGPRMWLSEGSGIDSRTQSFAAVAGTYSV